MVAIFFVIIFMFGFIYSPYLSAGETLFKECKACGQLNYQFTNTCSLCFANGPFEDVWLKDDCDKRDGKKNKSKSINWKKIEKSEKKQLYNIFVRPIDIVVHRLCYEQNEEIKEIIPHLIEVKEHLIKLYGLEKYRKNMFPIRHDYDDY